jgi:OmcA/MtrC family decaheme c-type cytochrome
VTAAVAASPLVVPTNAVMVTAAMIGGFTQDNLAAFPYTAADATKIVANASYTSNNATITCPTTPQVASCVTTQAAVGSGLHVTGVLAKKEAATTSTGGTNTARRVITSAALCNNCHDMLGNSRAVRDDVYKLYDGLSPAFHSGDRNDPTACQFCHNPNKADSGTGWQVNSSTWIHGIHGASKRTVTYGGAGYDWSSVLYPGQLKDCNQCHLPNTVNFGNGSSGQGGGYTGGTLTNNLLWTTTATGTALSQASAVAATNAASYAVENPQLHKVTNATVKTSPYVTYGAAYGSGFTTSVNAASAVATVTQAAGTTLVNSPIASACFACHTDQTAVNHIQQTGGGIINSPRSSHLASDGVTLVNTESCLACHGQGTTMDAAVIHQAQ